MAKALRVYADTSVFGGVFDEEFKEESESFFQQCGSGKFILVSSALVEQELQEAPEPVKLFFKKMLPEMKLVEITEEALQLQQAYLKSGILPAKFATDALHVAVATVGRTDFIVSWNFQHLVHYDKIRMYNAVNRLQGCPTIELYSPKEVIDYEDKNL